MFSARVAPAVTRRTLASRDGGRVSRVGGFEGTGSTAASRGGGHVSRVGGFELTGGTVASRSSLSLPPSLFGCKKAVHSFASKCWLSSSLSRRPKNALCSHSHDMFCQRQEMQVVVHLRHGRRLPNAAFVLRSVRAKSNQKHEVRSKNPLKFL